MVSPDQVLDLHARIQLEGPQDRTGLPQQLLKARCDRFDGVLQAVLARLGYPDLCRHVRNVLKADSEGTRQWIYKWVQIARAKSLRSERAEPCGAVHTVEPSIGSPAGDERWASPETLT